MSSYIIEYDELKKITFPLEYSAIVCNRTHITKIIFRGDFQSFSYDEDDNTTQQPCPFTVEINGKHYGKYVSISEDNYAWFDTDILLEKGDTLSIKVTTVSATGTGGNTLIYVYIRNNHPPGWNCITGYEKPKGFFAIEYEGTREDMWVSDGNDYPTLNGVTATFELYNNYNLPHPHKYKVRDDINDGYPYIHRIKSGWCAAYPYDKNGVWNGARIFVRINGSWKECRAAVYDAMSALYRRPNIKTAWKITFGKNGGYPYIVYGEIPFYDKE